MKSVKTGTGIRTINPATGEEIDRYEYTTASELDRILAGAEAASSRFSRTPVEVRVAGIRALSETLATRREEFAVQIVNEMGKPIGQALGEIDKCINTCEYYADNLPRMLAAREVDVKPDAANVHLRPLGVVFAILPWNYPWWQVVRAMLPAIGVGNTVVLKHAESVTGCAFSVQDAFCEAFGERVMSAVVLPGESASETIGDRRIAAVTFTGSEQVGALVAATAGQYLKKCVLELGGSDPFIVLEDSDIEAAAEAAVKSRFLNNGQSCIAAKRIIAPLARRNEFIAALQASMQELSVGDPLDPEIDVGPVARFDLLETLTDQRKRGMNAGAEVISEVNRPDGPGAWFAPGLVTVGDPDSPLLREEIFGPLGAVTFWKTEEEAIAIANDTKYGLSSSVWSRDIERAKNIAARLCAGSVFVNSISASDPRLPVGGIKASGYGRELADYGVAEFANVQSVRIAT